jgi:hypothetical protein
MEMPQVTVAPDLATIARDLRAKVLAGQDLTKEEAAQACAYIRQGRRMTASLNSKKSSNSAPPRSANELLGAFGLGPK